MIKGLPSSHDFREEILLAQASNHESRRPSGQETEGAARCPNPSARRPDMAADGARAAFPQPCGRRAPGLWARGHLLMPFPLVPINIPQGPSVERYPENRVVFVRLLRIVVVVSF